MLTIDGETCAIHAMRLEKTTQSATERLQLAARKQLVAVGYASCSARLIAREAQTAASAINYGFSGIEQLFGVVFDAALTEIAAWRADREAEAALFAQTPDGAALFLEGLILEWAAGARDLALLYQELLAAPASFDQQARDAIKAWVAFFDRLAAGFKLEREAGAMMHLMFQAEALYALSRWRPLLERAALGELIGHFGGVWLGAKPRPRGHALATAESSVRIDENMDASGQAQALMAAAMAVVAEHGLASLTHRAVAARCGMTAGAVAHYFRSSDDLVAAAVQGQVAAIKAQASRSSSLKSPQSLEELARILASQEVFEAGDLAGRGRRRIFLATVRDPSRAAAGATVRFAQGSTVAGELRRCMGMRAEVSLHASVLSRLISAAPIVARAHERFGSAGTTLVRGAVDRFVSEVGR